MSSEDFWRFEALRLERLNADLARENELLACDVERLISEVSLGYLRGHHLFSQAPSGGNSGECEG